MKIIHIYDSFGSGHISRLKSIAYVFSFSCVDIIKWITTESLDLKNLEKVDFIIIDSYAISNTEIEHLKQYCKNVIVIDDSGMRFGLKNVIILNPNIYEIKYNCENEYLNYPMVHPYFLKNNIIRVINKKIKRIAITLGTTEQAIELAKSIRDKLQEKYYVETIIPENNYLKSDIVKVLQNSDIAITSCGVSAYEAVATKTPMIGICMYNNQMTNAIHLLGKTMSLYLEKSFKSDIEKHVEEYSYKKRLLHSTNCLDFNFNGAEKLVKYLQAKTLKGY